MPNKTKSARTETGAKILLFDAETSPNIGFTWGKWEQDVIEFIKERQIICFAWKWLGQKRTHVKALPDFKSYKRDRDNNKALIAALHAEISKADIVVGHNIDGFDDKRANTDFIKHGFKPPSPHMTVDTLKVVRAKFQFNSNKLNDLGAFLKVGQKVKHSGFELWRQCMTGNPAAWILMKKYNAGDVNLLERVYLKIRPWMTNHPAIKERGETKCPACDSCNLQSSGWKIQRAGKKPRYHCQNCGHWSMGMLVKKDWMIK